MKSKTWRNTTSVRVIIIIAVLIFPLNILALVEVDYAKEQEIGRVEILEKHIANLSMSSLNMKMKNSVSLLYYFLTKDANCIEMTGQSEDLYTYNSAKNKFFVSLNQMANMTDGAEGYFYYMIQKDDSLTVSTANTGHETGRKLIDLLQTDGSSAENPFWLTGWHLYALDHKEYLVYCFDMGNYTYGAWLDTEPIISNVMKESIPQGISAILSESSSHDAAVNQISISANAKNIWMHIDIDRKIALKQLSIFQKALSYAFILYLAIIPILYFFLRRLLIRPLHMIQLAHRQIEQGNGDFRIQETGKTVEFEELFQSFNHMANQLRSYKIASYEKELERQKMELRNLQLQIRPHFLLNTFNVIFVLVKNRQNESAQDIILYLSDYFRYLFRTEKDLELFGKEEELIKGYLKVASIRYQNRIQAEYTFDPEISLVRTPPLLIHNFVENAVKYGIQDGNQTLCITVRGEYNDGAVTFYIIDNGKGMDEAALERNRKIFSGELELKDEKSHIGLYNSLKRLKYFYGDEAKISVESEPNVMTAFIIEFPYNMEVNDDTADGE